MKHLLLIFFTLISTNTFGALKITGNNRTQDKFIEFIFNRCLKKRVIATKKQLPTKLSQCMMNERIFHRVNISEIKDGWSIDVKERWTLIPIPRFEADTRGNKYYGLGIAESNLFGRRIILYAEFITGTINQFSVFYLDPSFMLTNNVFRWRVALDNNDIQQLEESSTVDGFEQKEWAFNIGFGHDWRKFVLTGLVEYINRKYNEVQNFETPGDYEKAYVGANFFYDNRDFKISYSEGLLVLLKLRLQAWRSDNTRPAHQLGGLGNYTIGGFWNHRFKMTGHFFLTTTKDERDALKRGRGRGFRGTLQYSIWAQSYAGLILGYDVPIISWDWGTWVAGLFSDLTYIKNVNNLPNTKFYSGGVGTYIYLKKLAVPGFGVEYGWQNEAKTTFWALNVGFDF